MPAEITATKALNAVEGDFILDYLWGVVSEDATSTLLVVQS